MEATSKSLNSVSIGGFFVVWRCPEGADSDRALTRTPRGREPVWATHSAEAVEAVAGERLRAARRPEGSGRMHPGVQPE